jgi:hypothetical protein
MLIWSGKGLVVLLEFLLAIVIIILGDKYFSFKFDISAPLGFLAATLSNYYFHKWLVKTYPEQTLINPKTGKEFVFKESSSLYYIPIEYWTYVFLMFFIGTFLKLIVYFL